VNELDPAGFTDVSGIRVNNRFFRELRSIDMIGAVRRISSPVLIFHGSDDRVVTISNHELMKNNLKPGYRAFVIEGGDHSLTRDSDIGFMLGEIKKWLAGFND